MGTRRKVLLKIGYMNQSPGEQVLMKNGQLAARNGCNGCHFRHFRRFWAKMSKIAIFCDFGAKCAHKLPPSPFLDQKVVTFWSLFGHVLV